MLFRFSLYGFLKNQRFFEPVFYLILLNEKDLNFTLLGLLIGFGEACVNFTEVPSGAIADIYGRKRCMIFSFISYIASFIIFALAKQIVFLFFAMFFYSIGDAFRTGTHKAMIFDWLRSQGKHNKKTKVYGITRSWSKAGSALSAIIGVTFMLGWQTYYPKAQYSHIFLLCIVPYLIGIINFLGYPNHLDRRKENLSTFEVFVHLWDTLKDSVRIQTQRRLFIESMGFEGVFKTVKDYIQPIANQMVLGLSVFFVLDNKDEQTTLVVYSIYFTLSIVAIFASRYSHRFSKRMGGEEAGCRFIWWLSLILYSLLTLLLYFEYYIVAIIAFIGLHFLQNLWRPILLSRFDTCSSPGREATMLSIESQVKSFFTIIAAPLLGFTIDYINNGSVQKNFWPVPALGLIIVLLVIATGSKSCNKEYNGNTIYNSSP